MEFISKELFHPLLFQMDIEWSASGANVSLESVSDTQVAKFAQKLSHHPLNINKHLDYLDHVCKEFFRKVSEQVKRGSIRQSNLYTPTTSEILQHFHLCKGRCEVFEGREEIVAQVENYLESDASIPLSVFGRSGCGKTSVMARITEKLCSLEWKNKSDQPYLTLVRFLGTTPQTSNLYLLIVSICEQLSLVLNEKWEEPTKFLDLVRCMHGLFERVGQKWSLVVLLDSIDQLMPAYNAYKMNWLPSVLPANVKVIVSTIEEGYPILDAMKEEYSDKGAEFIEVKQLGEVLGMRVVEKWLSSENRTMTEHQREVVNRALAICSLPLYARIAFDHIRKWKSYDVPTLEVLEVTVKGAINQLFVALETKLGEPLIKHSLSYLTASRHGLSEVELEHLMSLDDVLLGKVYKFWRPPVRRIPPLLWTRVRAELSSYIVERSADDIVVLYWYHRQFIEATRERYLKDPEFVSGIRVNMLEYFLGKWGDGKEKPFVYTEHQKQRFGLDDIHSKADRKVPNQPYIFEASVGGNTQLRYNKRKLFELPFHLLKNKSYDMLKTEVFFNFSWLYATLNGLSAMSILDEFEIFMKADKYLRHDADMRVLFANMRMIRPYISKYPNSLSYELSGRLSKLITSSAYIKKLVYQCDTEGLAYCPLLPMMTCFATADAGLQQNINYRAAESWHQGGAFAITRDFKTMYIIDYDDIGTCTLASWDIDNADLIHEVPVIRPEEETRKHVYIEIHLDKTEEQLIAFNRWKHYNPTEQKDYGEGFVDIIRISDAHVLRTISHSLHKDILANPLMYMTENWIACKMGTTFPMYNIDTGQYINLNRCHMLTADEEYLVINQCHKTILRKFENKEAIWEFDPPGTILSISVLTDFAGVIMAGPAIGELRTYDLRKKQLKTEKLYGYILKTKHMFTIPKKVADFVEGEMKVDESGQLEVFVKLIVTTDDEYALAVYQSRKIWIPLLYKIYKGKRIASFVGQIGHPVDKSTRYPAFTHDCQHIVVAKNCLNGKKVVQIFSVSSGQRVFEYFLDQTIRDFVVSKTTDQIAVMAAKDVTFLSVYSSETEESAPKKDRKVKNLNQDHQQLLPREVVSEKKIHSEIAVFESKGGEVKRKELQVSSEMMDTDHLASARSKKKHAVDIRCTSDGLKVVQLHTRVQVVDTAQEEIKYTPRSGDTITRPIVSPVDGTVTNETVQIPTGAGRSEVLEMQANDRIVNENNKVKFRITSAGKSHVKIMSVPSIFTVYGAGKTGMEKLQRWTVYQESIATLSSKYMVTYRQKTAGDFFNVYSLEDGRLLATHEAQGGFSAASFTRNNNLIMISSSLVVRVYEAPTFLSCEIKIATHDVVPDCTWTVHDIILSREMSELDPMPPSFVMFYKPTKASDGIFRKFCYQYVDLTNRDCGRYIVLNGALEDIAKDGSYGIDSQLAVYSMKEGKVVRQVPYNNKTPKMHLHVRFTDDHQHVIFVDRADDTVHVVKITGHSFKHVVSCFTHEPKMDFFNGVTVRLNGKVIVFKKKDTVSTFLRLFSTDELPKLRANKNFKYTSEYSRALALVQ